ncbi:DUF6284 family protein [Streptomyces albidoflavus]
MKLIVAVNAAVTQDSEPTAAELAAIEAEMPVITAEVDLLDAQIAVLDRVPTEVDERRLRRARRRVLDAWTSLANRDTLGGAA